MNAPSSNVRLLFFFLVLAIPAALFHWLLPFELSFFRAYGLCFATAVLIRLARIDFEPE